MMFSGSVRGFSSFAAYRIPTDSIQYHFELQFKFMPETMEQIGLMLYMGQEDENNIDHLAVSFIRGHIALTWNLGAGPRRIFTTRPIEYDPKREHLVRISRTGSKAWLHVDDFDNIMGKSPGRFTMLNATPVIYFGGHKSRYFENLPHDLPLHSGFFGCLYDIRLHTGEITLGLEKLQQSISGRAVAECGTSECHKNLCHHQGVCLQYGSTYTCLCQEEFYGPLCESHINVCDILYHKCSFDSTCVSLGSDYECDCPVGKTGKYCEEETNASSSIYFSGKRSYMGLTSRSVQRRYFDFEFDLKPLTDHGIILLVNWPKPECFLSLVLQGGILQLRIATEETSGRNENEGKATIITSGQVLQVGEWTKIKIAYSGQRMYFAVNNAISEETIPRTYIRSTNSTEIYLGGTEDLSEIKSYTVPGFPTYFTGCIRNLLIDNKPFHLDSGHAMKGRNVANCDEVVCKDSACLDENNCNSASGNVSHCEIQLSCLEKPCKNGGHCIREDNKPKCQCPLGWVGALCEKEIPPGPLLVKDSGYLILDKQSVLHKRDEISLNRINMVDYIHVIFSTTEPNGLILWSYQNNTYIGVGLERGVIKFSLCFNDGYKEEAYLNVVVNDGKWHNITFSTDDHRIVLMLDKAMIRHLSYETKRTLHTDGLFYIGGFPDGSVTNRTNRLYQKGFSGCIREVSFVKGIVIDSFENYKGEYIDRCLMSH